MQQNIKGFLLLFFLIGFSFISFQYFSNDVVETVPVPLTTSTITKAVPVIEIEAYKAPAFNFDEIISSSLAKIDTVCEKTGNWFRSVKSYFNEIQKDVNEIEDSIEDEISFDKDLIKIKNDDKKDE